VRNNVSVSIRIHVVVEGEGDEKAIKTVLEKCIVLLNKGGMVQIARVQKTDGGGSMMNYACLIDKTKEAFQERNQGINTAILLLRDADNPKCPSKLASEQRSIARQLRYSNIPIGIVYAKCSFEAWLIASIHTIEAGLRQQNVNLLQRNVTCDQDPEKIAKPEKWIESKMVRRRPPPKYKKSEHQPQMAQHLDARHVKNHSPSFCHLLKTLQCLVQTASSCNNVYITPNPDDTQCVRLCRFAPCCNRGNCKRRNG
jgi:hypothetical protein